MRLTAMTTAQRGYGPGRPAPASRTPSPATVRGVSVSHVNVGNWHFPYETSYGKCQGFTLTWGTDAARMSRAGA